MATEKFNLSVLDLKGLFWMDANKWVQTSARF